MAATITSMPRTTGPEQCDYTSRPILLSEMDDIVGRLLRKKYKKNFDTMKARYAGFVEERETYVVGYDVWFWDDDQIFDGSVMTYFKLDQASGEIYLHYMDDVVEGKLCDERGGALEKIPDCMYDCVKRFY